MTSQMDPAHGPPLQARVAAANGTVLAACKLLALTPILAHMAMNRGSKMNRTGRGQSKMNGGQELVRAVGMAGKMAGRLTQPAEQGTAGRHSQRILRPAQASKQTATVGRPRSKNNSCRCWRPLAVQVSGGSAVMLALKKAGSDLPTPVPTPPIAFACHCPYPLP